MNRFLCLLVVFACLIPAAARAADADIAFYDEIPYVTRDAGKTVIFGDLYRPASEALRPGIVYAHGGGFVAGSKDAFGIPEVSRFLAQKGFVVFAVDYRLLQDGGLFPKNAQDVKCAVQWLRAHAAEYHVDTDRIAILGNSAGGYMASFVAVTQHNDIFNASCGDPALDAQKPEVDLAVSWFGVHDFTTMKHNLVKTMELSYFSKIKDKDAFKKEISPINYADQAPPMLLLHGTVDQLVPFDQSVAMCKAVTDAGGECTMVDFPGADHGFIAEKMGTPDAERALAVTVDWLNEHFAALPARGPAPTAAPVVLDPAIKDYGEKLCAQFVKDPKAAVLDSTSFEALEALILFMGLAGKDGIPATGIRDFLRKELDSEISSEDISGMITACTVVRAEPLACGTGLDRFFGVLTDVEFHGDAFMADAGARLAMSDCGVLAFQVAMPGAEPVEGTPVLVARVGGQWKIIYLN